MTIDAINQLAISAAANNLSLNDYILYLIYDLTLNPTSSGWSLTGNSGTTAGTNFIGTTDNVDLVFKTNNATRLTISSAGVSTFGDAVYINAYGLLSFSPATNFSINALSGQALLLRTLGAQKILFATNNTTHSAFDSSGNLGIGTQSPSQKLEIFGGLCYVNDAALGTYDGMKFIFEVGGGYWGIGFNSTLNSTNFLNIGSTTSKFIFAEGTNLSPSAKSIRFNLNTSDGEFVKFAKSSAIENIYDVDTVQTTNATVTTVSTIATTTGEFGTIELVVNCKKTAGTGTGSIGDTNAYVRNFKYKNNSGTLTLGTFHTVSTDEDIAAFDVSITTSGTNILVQVTGAADDTVTWDCHRRVYKHI